MVVCESGGGGSKAKRCKLRLFSGDRKSLKVIMFYCIFYCILSQLNSNITYSWCIIVLCLMSKLFVACCIFNRYYTHFPFAASLDSTLALYLRLESMLKSLSASIKRKYLFILTTLKTLLVTWVKKSS